MSDKCNLLLIDSVVKDHDILISALNSNTHYIVYTYDMSHNYILDKINNEFLMTQIDRIALCCHEGHRSFVNNHSFFDISYNEALDTNMESMYINQHKEIVSNINVDFLVSLTSSYHITHIDFLACNSLKSEIWNGYYTLLSHKLPEGVIIGASNDNTGNIKYDGDWILESTGEDIEQIYFTSNIEYYKYILSSVINGVTYSGNNVISAQSPNLFTYDTYTKDGIDYPHIVVESNVNGYTITTIDDEVFSGANMNHLLMYVDLPNSITTIGENSFSQALLKKQIPYFVQSLGKSSYDEYWILINNDTKKYDAAQRNPVIRLPASLTTVSSYSFNHNYSQNVIVERYDILTASTSTYESNGVYVKNISSSGVEIDVKLYKFDHLDNFTGYYKYVSATTKSLISEAITSSNGYIQYDRVITQVILSSSEITEINTNYEIRISVSEPCYNIKEFITFEHTDLLFDSNLITLSNFVPYENDQMNKEWVGYMSVSTVTTFNDVKLKINSSNNSETLFSIVTATETSVYLHKGWNLIGSMNEPSYIIDSNNIINDSTPLYGYNSTSKTYTIANQNNLIPGNGYWCLVDISGAINMRQHG